MDTIHELNASILKITMKIRENYPELSKYIEEMHVTLPAEENPEITIRNLQTYRESLNTMLSKYIMECRNREFNEVDPETKKINL